MPVVTSIFFSFRKASNLVNSFAYSIICFCPSFR